MFNASVDISVGSGASLLFWEDPWLHGLSVAAVAPEVLKLVRPGVMKRRTVRDGVLNHAWARDIVGELSVDAVVQYLRLWSTVAGVPLNDDRADIFRWKWMDDSNFTVRSSYRMFFHGTTALPGAAHVWNSFAPFKFRFHAWLSLHGRCWTADHRLRRGLPSHVLCPLCSASAETADHLALQCPFARTMWDGFSRRARVLIPTPASISSEDFLFL
ncbi:hypothetical protein ACQ4PT_069688 [Festuca glaucescens]